MTQQPNTHASDVFSLGLVLFFLLTDGEHALGGEHEQLMHLCTLIPNGPGEAFLRSNLPARLQDDPAALDLIGAMVQNEPARRPPIAAAFF